MDSGNFFNPLGGGGGEIPEQVREEIVNDHVRRSKFFFELRHFLRNTEPHVLWLLEGMLGSIANAEDESAVRASYYHGIVDALLTAAGTCPDCGIDHYKTDTLDRLTGNIPPPFKEEVASRIAQRESRRENRGAGVVVDESSRMDLMLEYKLKPRTDDPVTGVKRDGLECMKCGYPWPTIEDRIANGDADSCIGCFQKAAHG